ADQIRDLARGEFLALGPAISRRPINVKIGPVATATRNGSAKLMPLPAEDTGDLRDRLFATDVDDVPPPMPAPAPPSMAELMQIAASPMTSAPVPDVPVLDEAEQDTVRADVLEEMATQDAGRTPS